jgi:hypothetical protein
MAAAAVAAARSPWASLVAGMEEVGAPPGLDAAEATVMRLVST